MTLIDQNKNYASLFGSVFRSSAIFYIAPNVSTTISISNYWKYKNNLNVSLIITVRDMNGNVVSREEESFDGRWVINRSDFTVAEGSIEIEAMGNCNLRIPYAAIMVIYEATDSISMVHSYARNHSIIEIEDGHALTQGREGCWSVRAGEDIENLAIFHNGHISCEEQDVTLFLTDLHGKTRLQKFLMPPLAPFATYIFDVEKIIPDFRSYLGGTDGWATVHFDNHSAFTRLLLLWRRSDGTDLQATHSNFDYEELQTNLINIAKPALMKFPDVFCELDERRVIVFPNFQKGDFTVASDDTKQSFSNGLIIENPTGDRLSFTRHDDDFPSRLVTSISGARSPDALAFECSLGIMHENVPPKRFHWTPVSGLHLTRLHIVQYQEFKDAPDDILLAWKLYNDHNEDVLDRQMNFASLLDVPSSLALVDIFPEAEKFLDGNYGYISLFSNFTSLILFTSIQKDDSMTVEHSF